MRDIREEVKEYLENNYTDISIDKLIQTEVVDGCWVDDDWEESGDYESEYDWYVEFGKGEA